MDWGIARPMGAGGQALEAGIELNQADGSQGADLQRTRLGSAIGTPSYMSPEQAAGKNAELDGRSDQYAMGLILQECVSLRRAVGGTTLQEILTKAREAKRDQVVVDGERGHVPVEIEAIVQRATRLAPADRYPTIRALADDVRRYMRGEAIEALPDSATRKAARWIGKHRMQALTALLAIGLLGATGTAAALVVGQARLNALHARQLRVSELGTESAIEAQLVDKELGRYELALSKVVGATDLALSRRPPGESAAFFAPDLLDKATAPADFGPSPRYGKPLSILVPVAATAPGVAKEPLDPLLRSMALLGPTMRDAMIESSGADPRHLSTKQERAAIAESGVPAHRFVVALAEGATVSFPAIAAESTEDVRTASWFKLAVGSTGVKWGPVVMSGNLALLPGSAALYDDRGAFRGVALVEVALDRLLARPGLSKLEYVQSRLLVGRDGKLVSEDNAGGARAPLAPALLAAIGRGESGSLEAIVEGTAWQYAFYPLATLDWYFVAASQAERLLRSETRTAPSDPHRVAQATSAAAPPADTSPQPVATALRPAAPVEADAGADAGADVDAGADAGVAAGPDLDAGAGIAPDPRKQRWPDAGAAPTATPAATAAPTGAPPPPPNPFDKWRVYDKKKPGSP
jgi:serine/threonine-protein kinase